MNDKKSDECVEEKKALEKYKNYLWLAVAVIGIFGSVLVPGLIWILTVQMRNLVKSGRRFKQ